MDRLTYNSDGRTLDELVISDAHVHLEQLDNYCFMLIVENKQHHWHLRIAARNSRAFVDAWVHEEFKPDEARARGEAELKEQINKVFLQRYIKTIQSADVSSRYDPNLDTMKILNLVRDAGYLPV